MLKRLITIGCLLAFGLSVSGCSKCGFWWDEDRNAPKSCKGDW